MKRDSASAYLHISLDTLSPCAQLYAFWIKPSPQLRMYLMDGPLDYYGPIFTFYKGGSQFKPFCGHSKFWSIINLEHDTFAVWNLARSWTVSTWLDLKI